jgi:hypothetical protein
VWLPAGMPVRGDTTQGGEFWKSDPMTREVPCPAPTSSPHQQRST